MFYAFIWKPDTEFLRKNKTFHKAINLNKLSSFYAFK